jgi:hypothetical protein
MTDKQQQPEPSQPQPDDTESATPDPLALAVASTAEPYTADKLTPDPESVIGQAATPVAAVAPLPDTAEKPEGPTPVEQLSLPEEEEQATDESANGGGGEESTADSNARITTSPTQQPTEQQPRGVTDPSQ